MLLFTVSYERFLEEIRIEKIAESDRNKLEREDLGSQLAYYLTSLDRKIAFVYVVSKKDITDVQKIQLDPISKNSIRVRDNLELRNISAKLEKIEQALQNPINKIETQ